MNRWRILLTDGLHPSGQDLLRAAAEVDDCKGITVEALLEVIDLYDGVIIRSRTHMDKQAIEHGERLKVIGRAGAGVDNIDLSVAAANGVAVVNAPLSTTLAVAEHTLALMFALARAVSRADASMKSGQWAKEELQGVELAGKTLGILGMGRIGSMVTSRATALGMHVLGYDPLLPKEEILRRNAEPVTLDELYERANFISLHLPLTSETKNLIDGQALGKMQRGVRLVCTARGGILDETALLGALESGQVAGVALDVYAKEPPGMNAVVSHPRVVATPHIAARTVEAQARAAMDISGEVLAILRGEQTHWRVV